MNELYRKENHHTRWASFENPAGAKGAGSQENLGAKGHAFDTVAVGETKTLLAVSGSGLIRRIWLTLQPRAPEQLRAYRLQMFWDGARAPAVSVPLGDFFCAGLGLVSFENELFASAEGRSFICTVPMPFRNGALITLTNESGAEISHLFYEINYTLSAEHDADVLYFHHRRCPIAFPRTHNRAHPGNRPLPHRRIAPHLSAHARFGNRWIGRNHAFRLV